MANSQDRLKELKIDRTLSDSHSSGNNLILGLLAVFLVAAAGAGWWWYQSSSTPEVEVAAARTANSGGAAASASVLDASGYVTARRRATVSSKVTGKITEVNVEEGLEVEEDQVLARLDDSLPSRQLTLARAQTRAARSALEEIEVRLAEAELDLGRTRDLVAAEIESQAALDRDQASVDALRARLAAAREDVEVAERQVALAEQQLEDTIIRAPFDGVVVTKDAQPGEMISPVSAGGGFTRTGICTVVDMSSLEIEVDVNEAYIQRVHAGQKATATLDAYPDWRIPSTVITPVPTADRQKATVQVRIAFDELDPRILPEMGVKVSFLDQSAGSGDTTPAAPRLLVPTAALHRRSGKEVVFVVEDGELERRAVEVGARSGGEVEVLAGLAEGERVVVAGPENMADGMEVQVAENP